MGGAVGDVVTEVQTVVHVAGEGGPSLPVEDGQPVESFESEGTVVVFSGADWLPEGFSPAEAWPKNDDGFGYTQQVDETLVGQTAATVASFSTPTAKQAGQTLNPVARLSAGELLTTERGRELLVDSGVLAEAGFEADEPESLGFARTKETFARPKETFVSLPGGETPLESFVGVVRDDDVLRLVLANVARSEADGDVAFLAGFAHRELWAAPGEGEFGTEHVERVADALAEADLGPLLLEGEDPLVTRGGVEASAAEMASFVGGFERVSSGE